MRIEALAKLFNVLRYGGLIKLAVVAALLFLGFAIGSEVVHAKEIIEDEDALV